MEFQDVIFINDLPSIDLHGLDRDTARVKVLEFINDNKKQKQEFFSIVHGIGSGIIRNEVHTTLKRNKNVIDLKQF